MAKGFFITGTDTGVGKTTFSVALIHHLKNQGKKVSVLKPVASDCEKIEGEFKNEDALQLIEASETTITYQNINPIAFEQAIAPHLAAQKNNTKLQSADIYQRCKPVLEGSEDFCIVEGAGGWLVPLNEQETMADLARFINLPVILVVSIKLGCINHALLTIAAIKQSSLPIAGWVANVFDEDMDELEENIVTLKSLLTVPFIARLDRSNSGKKPLCQFYSAIL